MTGTVLVVRILLLILVAIGFILVLKAMIRYGQKERLLQQKKEAAKANQGAEITPRSSKTSRLNMNFFKGKEQSIPIEPIEQPEINMPIVILPRYGRKFTGEHLDKIINKFGFQYSPNKTYEMIADDRKNIFCTMINIFEPGTFPAPESLQDYTFDGMLMILQLPVNDDPVNDWETFYAVVCDIANFCDGRLCDYTHALLGDQDIELYHQAVQEFEKKYLAWQSRR